jgi:hypothetical protein
MGMVGMYEVRVNAHLFFLLSFETRHKKADLIDVLSELFPLPPKRLLPHAPLVPIPGEQMTVERCLDGCAAAGYNAAALETGQAGFLSPI